MKDVESVFGALQYQGDIVGHHARTLSLETMGCLTMHDRIVEQERDDARLHD
jgi:hypothetical protein